MYTHPHAHLMFAYTRHYLQELHLDADVGARRHAPAITEGPAARAVGEAGRHDQGAHVLYAHALVFVDICFFQTFCVR
jgi:hypothetical protein